MAGRDDRTRNLLAWTLVLVSAGGIIVAGGLAIWLAGADRPETTRLVFTSMLPLFGTWVGTVLAFYFARENLQTATENTLRLTARGGSPGTPVTEVMIPRSRILSYDLAPGEDPDAITLAAIYDRMQSGQRHRLPIFDSSGAVRYIVHDSLIALYLGANGESLADIENLGITLGQLRQNPDCSKAVSALGFVTDRAVLAEARATMRAVEGSNDVFVTADGKPTSPVLGWLTNTDLAARQ